MCAVSCFKPNHSNRMRRPHTTHHFLPSRAIPHANFLPPEHRQHIRLRAVSRFKPNHPNRMRRSHTTHHHTTDHTATHHDTRSPSTDRTTDHAATYHDTRSPSCYHAATYHCGRANYDPTPVCSCAGENPFVVVCWLF